MKRCVGIRRKDEISGGSLDACFWMLVFGQWVVRAHGMRSGSKKLNYFLKNYARAVGRSYIIYLFGSCDRGVLEKVTNKIVINKLKITRERIQFLVNMSFLKVLLKVMKSKQLS